MEATVYQQVCDRNVATWRPAEFEDQRQREQALRFDVRQKIVEKASNLRGGLLGLSVYNTHHPEVVNWQETKSGASSA